VPPIRTATSRVGNPGQARQRCVSLRDTKVISGTQASPGRQVPGPALTGRTVYVVNGGAGTVTPIRTATNTA